MATFLTMADQGIRDLVKRKAFITRRWEAAAERARRLAHVAAQSALPAPLDFRDVVDDALYFAGMKALKAQAVDAECVCIMYTLQACVASHLATLRHSAITWLPCRT